MNNLVWLASYPKSGNTWLRIFLTNLFSGKEQAANINNLEKMSIASSRNLVDEVIGIDSSDLTHDEIDNLRPEIYEYISNNAMENSYHKIHDAFTYLDDAKEKPLIPYKATKKAIYILRNPLDVTISFANHSGISIDKSIKRMADDSFCFSEKNNKPGKQLRQKLLSWSDHVNSWTQAENINLHIVRYEDMKKEPFESFGKIVDFLELDYSTSQINKALQLSSFSELKKQEQEQGFKERSANCSVFFNKGESGYWKEILTDEQIKQITQNHNKVMTKFGYLD